MEDKIRSYDLCERCVYFYCNDACALDVVGACRMQTDEPPGCRCNTVKMNTPCPYFVDTDEGGNA